MTPLPIDEFDYPLPENRIAKYPLTRRDKSKLLVYKDGIITEDRFFNLGAHILPQALLVYNNTRVIPARMVFHKTTGAQIEIFCLEPVEPRDYQLALSATDHCVWKCMVGNLKKWKEGVLCCPFHTTGQGQEYHLQAERLSTQGNTHHIRFSWDAADLSFAEVLELLGEIPIPPYLNRPTEESDKTTYQTVYSHIKGSVAAPTAGLHFTTELLDRLRQQGIHTTELTLHVGAGTFQPVKTDDANLHVMHTEIIAVPLNTLRLLNEHLEHIVAVGTTSMRTLESLYWLGLHVIRQHTITPETMHVSQFEPYEQNPADLPDTRQTLTALIHALEQIGQDTLHAETQIMIRPGYHFRLVKQLITNFHQPRSTLLLLVSACVGDDWKQIYRYALDHDFRFLSYGDSSILTLRTPS